MEEKNNSVIQAEFDGLKDLITEKFNNVCENVKRMDCTLKEHNGRLGTIEKIVEQGKGAGKMVSSFWGLIGGGVISMIVYFLTKHL